MVTWSLERASSFIVAALAALVGGCGLLYSLPVEKAYPGPTLPPDSLASFVVPSETKTIIGSIDLTDIQSDGLNGMIVEILPGRHTASVWYSSGGTGVESIRAKDLDFVAVAGHTYTARAWITSDPAVIARQAGTRGRIRGSSWEAEIIDITAQR
jgi:hypothetical protein